MSKRQPNSVSVLAAAPSSVPDAKLGTSHSVEVRPIDNGYVVRTSNFNGREYSCTETYSATRPEVGVAATPTRTPNSLRAASKYLKG